MAIVCGWSGEALAQAARDDAPLAPAPPSPAAPSSSTAPAATTIPTAADPPPLAPRRPAPRKAEVDKFVWRYPEFRTSEYFVTGAFGALTIGGLFIPTSESRGRWENGLDDGVRDALRAEDRDMRKLADDASDVTLIASLNWIAFDAGVVAWWGRNKGSVAYQMAAIDIETMAITAGINSLVKGIAARERPYGDRCDEPGEVGLDDCESDSRNRAFFSGHSSSAFAAASLTCTHHAHLALYDDPVADAAACVSAMGLAGATGVLRIVSDNHHTTDVVTGALIGTTIGFGVPWLLHYKDEIPEDGGAAAPPAVSVQIIPGPTSATVVGTF